jgi:hypothetical protein
MRAPLVIGLMAALASTSALAQDAPQPKYPPGFDCETLPAGDERDDCRQSPLTPATGRGQNDRSSLSGAALETPGSVSPPTFPNESGNDNRDNGPGSMGGAGGIGN